MVKKAPSKESVIKKNIESLTPTDVFTYAESVKQLVILKQQEFDDLQQKVLLAKVSLRNTNEANKVTQSSFNQRLAKERQEFNDTKTKALNKFAAEEDKFEKLTRLFAKREDTLKQGEKQHAEFNTKKREMFAKRVEVEKLQAAATIEYSRAKALQSEANTKMNVATVKLTNAEKTLADSQSARRSIDITLEKTKLLEKENFKQLDNITKIREELEPQIAENTKREQNAIKVLKEATQKENALISKIEEDKILLAKAIETSERNRKDQIRLATWQEELSRRELQIKPNKK